MGDAEVKKMCRSCGVDLHHKQRHKSRDGTYLCPDCLKARNTLGQRIRKKLTDKKSRIFVLYAIIAVLICLLIWTLIDVFSQMEF